jgi:hypothetical protein
MQSGETNTSYDIYHQESAMIKEIIKVLYNFLVAPFEPARIICATERVEGEKRPLKIRTVLKPKLLCTAFA